MARLPLPTLHGRQDPLAVPAVQLLRLAATGVPRFAEMGKERGELWAKFLAYYDAVFADGALTVREKALLALAVAHALQCPYCIDAYTQASLQNGADREQLTEAVHVACAIRGGASLVHGVQMRNAADKLGV